MIKDVLDKFAEKFNADLEKVMNDLKGGELVSAMRYAACGGGKRLRPFMVLLAAEMGGANYDDVFPLMVGVELIHTYSLVHDDLPCMDDDDMRRGRKSTHAVYGEAMGVLAGDALLNYAYEYMLEGAAKAKNVGGYITAINCIMVRAGYGGMLGGQSYDINENLKAQFKREDYINMYSGKTGALFQAAIGAGAFAAGLPVESVTAMLKYAMYLGVAFQLKDDLDDIKQDGGTVDAASEKVCNAAAESAEQVAEEQGKKAKKPCLTMLSTFEGDTAKEFVTLNADVAVDTVKHIKGSENLVELARFITAFEA